MLTMSKERLEEIKNTDISYLLYGTRLKEQWDWLIEQAERLHGYNHKLGYIEMYADCNRHVGNDSMKIHDLEQQIMRYRKAIEKALAECVKDRPITAENILAKALERESNG